MKMRHEKKKLRVYIYRIEEIDHGNFSFSNIRGGGWRYEDEPWEKKTSCIYLFFKYEGGSNFKSNTHVHLKIYSYFIIIVLILLYFFIDAPDYYSCE